MKFSTKETQTKIKINNSFYDLDIKHSTFKNYTSLVKLIRKYSLFASTGEIQLILNDVEKKYIEQKDVYITVALIDKVPIACAVINRKKILCYVKEDYRRLKIGTTLVNMLKTPHCYATIGFSNSDDFWHSLNIPVIKF